MTMYIKSISEQEKVLDQNLQKEPFRCHGAYLQYPGRPPTTHTVGLPFPNIFRKSVKCLSALWEAAVSHIFAKELDQI